MGRKLQPELLEGIVIGLGVRQDASKAQTRHRLVATVARFFRQPVQGLFSCLGLARFEVLASHQKPGLLGIGGGPEFIFHVGKRAFYFGQITGLHKPLDFVVQRCCLRCLLPLPILVTIPASVGAQHCDEQPGDGVAVLFPKMLELIKLFLFFEIELVCHGGAELSGRL